MNVVCKKEKLRRIILVRLFAKGELHYVSFHKIILIITSDL